MVISLVSLLTQRFYVN